MLVGNTDILAIESELTMAFTRLSFRGLGFFLVHLGGIAYGVRSRDATLLACSFDHVTKRILDRGKHIAPFAKSMDGAIISNAAWTAQYSETYDSSLLGISRDELTKTLSSNNLVWAPDGDEAFDDGSHVLQFDIGDQVRIVGSRRNGEHQSKPSDLRDVWLPADDFYDTLETWRARFETEWKSTPIGASSSLERFHCRS